MPKNKKQQNKNNSVKISKIAAKITDPENSHIGEGFFQNALTENPYNQDLIENYISFCRDAAAAQIYHSENWEEAINYYQKALKYDEENIDILSLLANALKETGNIFESFLTLKKISKINKK